ncbi:hypothetical protein NQ318_022255 [Aromia moschata]|uniref:Nitroreductase domain-containing protein n=1 Tax=Aromia moschata TaxID=1265417 RepID=A0AAV8XH30_9CUCU|nr:hypothetical protein NQ318_022255 [Aromia moschata]
MSPESDSDSTNDNDEYIVPALPSDLKHIRLKFKKRPVDESIKRSEEFYRLMDGRRTVRHFSKEPIPKEIIYNIIKTAGTSPSGAHTEPWTFVAVSSLEMKQQIRQIIEDEEELNYKKRMGKIWTTDLKPLKTDWVKEYLTDAPYLILVFKQTYGVRDDGKKKLHYYNEQSVSIAWNPFGGNSRLPPLRALETIFGSPALRKYAGLVSLTSTPLNCGPALKKLIGRPASEKLTLLLPVGYPSEDCSVPDLHRKPLDDILIEI